MRILPVMSTSFCTVGQILTGAGSAGRLGELAAGLGSRALLVTAGEPLKQAGTTDKLAGVLADAGVGVALFEDVEPEPSVATVDRAREELLREGCDVVVAVGGGSAMDAGKCIAGLAGEPGSAGAYHDRQMPPPNVPCITVPTTAGTGAEVTPSSILTDQDRGAKIALHGPTLMPAAAVVDAELTLSCPPDVTAACGMDALTQAIESYLSLHATPLTEALSLHAIELVWLNLPAVFQHGEDIQAAEAMSYAALLSGMALANAGLGAAHAMAHSIGYRYHLRHGVVCAALLRHVLRLNCDEAGEKYEVLKLIFPADPADCAEHLLHVLDLPTTLPVREEDFSEIAGESMATRAAKTNPRPMTEDDFEDILRRLL